MPTARSDRAAWLARRGDELKVLQVRELLGVVAECEAGLLTVHDRLVDAGAINERLTDELYRVQRSLSLLRVEARRFCGSAEPCRLLRKPSA